MEPTPRRAEDVSVAHQYASINMQKMCNAFLLQERLGDAWTLPPPFHSTRTYASSNVPPNLHCVERDNIVKEFLMNWFDGFRESVRPKHVGGLSHESGYAPALASVC